MYEPPRKSASFYIAGFKNYDGTFVLSKLKVGKKLDLVPEIDNPYDPCAVKICRKGTKLGYVPKSENEMLSHLLFYGHQIYECRIEQVNPDAEPWKQVRVGLFVKDNRE